MASNRSQHVPTPPVDWREDAICVGLPPDEFYSPKGGWRRFCGQCPARINCLATALLNYEQHGVWGGCDENTRDRIIRRIRRGTATWDMVVAGAMWPDECPELPVLDNTMGLSA